MNNELGVSAMSEQDQNLKAQLERLTEAAVEYCVDCAPAERPQRAVIVYCAPHYTEECALTRLAEKLAIKIRKVLCVENKDPSELVTLFAKQTGWGIDAGTYYLFTAGSEGRANNVAASVSEWAKERYPADSMLFVSVDPKLVPPEDMAEFSRTLNGSLPRGHLLVVM